MYEDLRVKNKNDFYFVELPNGKSFYSRYDNIIHDINCRYLYSHYDLEKTSPKKYRVHRQHKDLISNIKCNASDFFVTMGDIVLEVGAYQGFGTLKLSEKVGPNGKVIAIEIGKDNFEVLCKNLKCNGIKNVLPINVGIWSKKDIIKVYDNDRQAKTLRKRLKQYNKSYLVDVNSIDNILSENNIKKVDYAFLEINLAEIDALMGMDQIISNSDNLRIVSAGWYKYGNGIMAYKKIKEFLENKNFKVYIGNKKRVYAKK